MSIDESVARRPIPQRIGIAAKPARDEVPQGVAKLRAWLRERGLEVLLDREAAGLLDEDGVAGLPRDRLPEEVDLLVVLGGDGTLLSVARPAAHAGVPVLGVNYGSLGFLTVTTRDELFAALETVLEGTYSVTERMMLRARVEPDGRDEAVVRDLLNDAVVNKTSLARIIELESRVNGELVSRFRADGLILATPTGSTAYSLAAGGPIVMPEVDAILLTPISPHTLSNRPLVLPASATIRVEVLSREEDVVLTLDGQEGIGLDPGDTVVVERSPHRFTLVLPTQRSYFEVLRAKLAWGS